MAYQTSEINRIIKDYGVESLDQAKLVESSESDIASALYNLEVDECRGVLRLLEPSGIASVLAELPNELSADILSRMREFRAVDVIEEFDPDDAADIVSELDEVNQSRLFKQLDDEVVSSIQNLMRYDPETAGGIMTPEFAGMSSELTIDEAIKEIRNIHEDLETIYYIYIIDGWQQLKGVVSMRQLVLATPDQKLEDIMIHDMQGTCHVNMDKEEVAQIMSHHNFLALPVVDENNTLLGIVTHDDILDVIQEEATEDMQKLVGAGGDEQLSDAIYYAFQKRAPWLLVNLLTSCLAAAVIYYYQETISQFTLLAVFLPIVANIAGNTGSQTLAVAIRSVSTGLILQENRLWGICLKESIKGVASGLPVTVLSAILGGFLAYSSDFSALYSLKLGITLLIAMQLSMALSSFTGVFVPMILRRFGFDPAQSASIFLTAFTDVAGFFLFLKIGVFFLQ